MFDHIFKHWEQVENMTYSEVFLKNFENVVKLCRECLIYVLNRN